MTDEEILRRLAEIEGYRIKRVLNDGWNDGALFCYERWRAAMSAAAGPFMWALNDDAGNLIGYMVDCPGCAISHVIYVNRPDRPRWDFDGNLDAPTFSPSLLVHWPDGKGRPMRVCHSFIRNGQWQFLSDCTHALAGQTVPMIPVEREQP